MTAHPSVTNQQINTVVPNAEVVDPHFLYYSLKPRKQELLALGSSLGTRTPILKKSAFAKLQIRVPPLATQARVARVLSAYDDLIENNRRRIQLLDQSARLLFKEWFVHLRFPGHGHVKVVDGVPERWKRRNLGGLCSFRAGNVFKPKYQGQTSGDYPFIKVRDMNSPGNRVSITEAGNWVSQDDCIELKGKPFPAGTSVFAKIGEALRQNRVRYLVRDTLIDNNLMGAMPNPQSVNDEFLFGLLSNYDLASNASGAAVPFLTVKVLSAQRFLVPDETTMVLFGDTIEPILKQITVLTRLSTEGSKARDLLLPRLMNGEVAV